jgi:flagellar biosynthetic protein FliP
VTRQIILLLLWLLAATAVVTAAEGTDEVVPNGAPAGAGAPTAVAEASQAAAEELGDTAPGIDTSADTASLVKWVALVTVISLAPALAVMVTSFTRIIVVLGLLRQGLAMPQLPPNQILFGLALLMTVVVMAPTIETIHKQAVAPMMNGTLAQGEAIGRAESSVRRFMIGQMESAGTADAVYPFLDPVVAHRDDLAWSDVPTWSMVPGFVLGELKVAFIIGLRVLLPFVIIDMLVGTVLVSMGVLMLPPVLIATPLKLLMFIMADGWTLVAGTLMSSFAT